MWKRTVIFAFIVGHVGFLSVDACTSVGYTKNKQKSNVEEDQAINIEETAKHQMVNIVLESRLGKGIDFRTYDNKHYIKQNGGPIDIGDDLACDFESPCCWANAEPKDKNHLDWNVVDENIDPKIFQRTFKKAERPSGHFLLATSAVIKQKLRAEFVSCDMLCSEKEVSVTFKHWTTPRVKLEVCSENAFASEKKEEIRRKCVDVPTRSSPGPTTIHLPAGEYFAIKFVASNFADKGGGLAILDDIVVKSAPCSRAPRPKSLKPPAANAKAATPIWPRVKVATRSSPAPFWPRVKPSNALIRSPTIDKEGNACEELTCDFENTICSYVDANGRISDRAVHFLHGNARNQSLGILPPAKGKAYAGAILRPGDSIALEATNLNITQDSFLRFQVLRTNTNLKLCLNTVSSCPFSTDQGPAFTIGSWKAARVKIPAKTHAVYFIGENRGDHIGVVGLDDVALLNSGDPNNSKC